MSRDTKCTGWWVAKATDGSVRASDIKMGLEFWSLKESVYELAWARILLRLRVFTGDEEKEHMDNDAGTRPAIKSVAYGSLIIGVFINLFSNQISVH